MFSTLGVPHHMIYPFPMYNNNYMSLPLKGFSF